MKTRKPYLAGKILRLMQYMLSPVLGILISGEALAFELDLRDISNSYSSCYFQDNGNNTSTVSIAIDYKTINGGNSNGRLFISRGLLVYGYDKNGEPKTTTPVATAVYLNGVRHSGRYTGKGYMIYNNSTSAPWYYSTPLVATVTAIVDNKALSEWPAVSIQAGTYTNGNDVAEIKGAAYIAMDENGDGSCTMITNPVTPPPVDINISVTAPDWNLGDLPPGESDTTLSRTDQQLCFSYSATAVQNQKFIIHASNANGVANNRYLLRGLSDTSLTVPYSLTLNNGSTNFRLPNNGTALPLNGNNRTCFVPTFKTEVGNTAKEGDYDDVLTFTITTKS